MIWHLSEVGHWSRSMSNSANAKTLELPSSSVKHLLYLFIVGQRHIYCPTDKSTGKMTYWAHIPALLHEDRASATSEKSVTFTPTFPHRFCFSIQYHHSARINWNNGRHFADRLFIQGMIENDSIPMRILLHLAPKGSINSDPSLLPLMHWRQSLTSNYMKQRWPNLETLICVNRLFCVCIVTWLFMFGAKPLLEALESCC